MIALALVLGGTAVAATSGTPGDTKADTKLMRKLAPTLSVKHAKTASNATRVGGKSAASLETSAYTYDLPAMSTANGFTVDLPDLPAGVYYASYDIVTEVDTKGQEVGCLFEVMGQGFGLSYGAEYVGSDYVSTSGSGIVDTRAHPVDVRCWDSSGNFSVDTDDAHPDVTLIPIHSLVTASATAALARRNPSVAGK